MPTIKDVGFDTSDYLGAPDNAPMSELLAKLTERQSFLSQQYQNKSAGNAAEEASRPPSLIHHGRFGTSSSEETVVTPASAKDAELHRLKNELEKANSQLRQMNRDRLDYSPSEPQLAPIHGLGLSDMQDESAFPANTAQMHTSGWNAPGSTSIWAPMQGHNKSNCLLYTSPSPRD